MTQASFAKLERQFAAGARLRGERYFRQGRVRLSRLDPGAVAAEVQGTHRYDASLRFDERAHAWQLSCSCRAFPETGPCKHLWATIEAARAAGKSVETEDEADEEPEPHDESDPATLPLEELRALAARHASSAERRLRYVLAIGSGVNGGDAVVHVSAQRRQKRGNWSDAKPFQMRDRAELAAFDPEDRAILALLRGATGEGMSAYGHAPSFALPSELQAILLPRMAATGRLHLAVERVVRKDPLLWDGGAPWEFGLSLARAQPAGGFAIEGFLARGAERTPLVGPIAVLPGGFVVTEGRLAPVDWRGAWESAAILRRTGGIAVPKRRALEALDLVRDLPGAPRVEAPGLLREVHGPPKPVLLVDAPHAEVEITARVAFVYDTERVAWRDPPRLGLRGEELVHVRRDEIAEAEAIAQLAALGAHLEVGPDRDVSIPTAGFARLVASLAEQGWIVEAEGHGLRSGGSLALSIRSGIDWFDLAGKADFGEASADLPDLLRAIEGGTRLVRLSDGSYGVLPEEWLAGWGLSGVATERHGSLRFQKSQAWLLDLLLAERGAVDVDAAFERARSALRRFERFEPAREPAAFHGELRGYQRDGLGWLVLLRDLGLGGCLADDMGLGKTVQVLALLAGESRVAGRPALVVAPRSVVFNWLRETERFAPGLTVLAHHGTDRSRDADAIAGHDLVVTTYGTLRRDAALLGKIRFSYAILDEAQAIKNPMSQAAKAARVLVAEHRLVLTGTPVENHLDDLWSLFEFLNPGMLGRSRVFREIVAPTGDAPRETDSTHLLARALRPFLLRRTKEQVLQELPPKVEQVIGCDLEGAERRRYDELRNHYRSALLAKVEEQGIERVGMHVLEALLRLRQAACHPGLVDPARVGESSAKLEALLPMLEEVRESGHKALVFSQFTSFLAIVRRRLDDAGVAYEYLDGKTRDREERVRRFQEDAACPLFLISLKAGGFGLNLTAADYVFLLDPWWNPAVERQAIDRTHRIGQTRTVNAYRLVARDTIEEKVLELQQKKRELAEAILGGTEGTLRDLTREDLERLLS
ncbi:MAG TPA: DEAD/DEAH box helicase [Planctomycetota bacterium]|nr:DEAD/DEAH box helicase [Planctomycetota bacterium]